MQSIAALPLIPPTSLADDQQRQKRTHSKVRTGCTTCKARRIKCDGVHQSAHDIGSVIENVFTLCQRHGFLSLRKKHLCY